MSPGEQVERLEHEGCVDPLLIQNLEPGGRVVAAGDDVVPGDIGARVGSGDARGSRTGAGHLSFDEHRVGCRRVAGRRGGSGLDTRGRQ